ncbi:transcription elongation factor, mitochondrial-like [Tachypleus tridentatus]|uniref:transcription elongation factor, mitochondrial-like n=1 Tax=Tachypleus tridentatus TaxID=6853 RepID=UPI003FD5370A
MMKLQRLKLQSVRHFCDSIQAQGSLKKCKALKTDKKPVVYPSLSKEKHEVCNPSKDTIHTLKNDKKPVVFLSLSKENHEVCNPSKDTIHTLKIDRKPVVFPSLSKENHEVCNPSKDTIHTLKIDRKSVVFPSLSKENHEVCNPSKDTIHTLKIDRKPVVFPSLLKEKHEVVNTILALNVSLPYITWFHLDRNMKLYSWERKLLYTVTPKNNLQSCYSVAKYAVEVLPNADLYVTEQKVSRPKHLSHVPFLLIQASIESMIFCMLHREQECNFYSIKDTTVASLFSLQVGSERASGQHVAEKILNNSSDYPTIYVSDSLQEAYRKESRVNKEYMCNVLLLGMAFYDCIFSVNS